MTKVIDTKISEAILNFVHLLTRGLIKGLKTVQDTLAFLQIESYSWLSLIRTQTGFINLSNYREIRIIESILAVFLLGGERKWDRIIEKFEL